MRVDRKDRIAPKIRAFPQHLKPIYTANCAIFSEKTEFLTTNKTRILPEKYPGRPKL